MVAAKLGKGPVKGPLGAVRVRAQLDIHTRGDRQAETGLDWERGRIQKVTFRVIVSGQLTINRKQFSVDCK